MDSVKPLSEPGEAIAEQGEVIIEGPDGIAFSLTPDAAEQTALRMIRAAGDARSQAGRDS